MDFKLFNTLIKFNDVNNYFENDPKYDFSNELYYQNLFNNLLPEFINPIQNDLRINQNSQVIGLGAPEFSAQTPFDILNMNRLENSDLGAYQHVIIED